MTGRRNGLNLNNKMNIFVVNHYKKLINHLTRYAFEMYFLSQYLPCERLKLQRNGLDCMTGTAKLCYQHFIRQLMKRKERARDS